MAAMEVELHWSGTGLRFESDVGGGVSLDGDAEAGPSPMQSLLLGLAGCMAIDVIVIVEQMRVPCEGLAVRVSAVGDREPARRCTEIALLYDVSGVDAGNTAH